MEGYGANDLVVIPVGRLQEIIGNVVDAKMEFWLNKKREEEIQEKHDEEIMLTIKECIERYKVSRSTIYNLTKKGIIPCSSIGAKKLISKVDIEKAIKSGSIVKS